MDLELLQVNEAERRGQESPREFFRESSRRAKYDDMTNSKLPPRVKESRARRKARQGKETEARKLFTDGEMKRVRAFPLRCTCKQCLPFVNVARETARRRHPLGRYGKQA